MFRLNGHTSDAFHGDEEDAVEKRGSGVSLSVEQGPKYPLTKVR